MEKCGKIALRLHTNEEEKPTYHNLAMIFTPPSKLTECVSDRHIFSLKSQILIFLIHTPPLGNANFVSGESLPDYMKPVCNL